ncbi:MAG: hypothetical protein ACXAEU_00565 [Candidatus Hodarchaeales archaeon]|jgi:hypothetical protein
MVLVSSYYCREKSAIIVEFRFFKSYSARERKDIVFTYMEDNPTLSITSSNDFFVVFNKTPVCGTVDFT